MTVKSKAQTGAAIVAELDTMFRAAVARLRKAIEVFVETGTPPDPAMRQDGSFAYPEIRLHYRGDEALSPPLRSFGRLTEAGDYLTSVTKPALFADYLAEQIDILIADYGVEVIARPGRQEIPFPYVLDANDDLADVRAKDLSRWFPTTELAYIGDEVADGLFDYGIDDPRPLALFDGLRTDFSLARLRHYTGTPPEHFQRYVLFTNYHRYVDEFVNWSCAQIGNGGSYTSLSCPGGVMVTEHTDDPHSVVADSAWRRHQMPAWHLMSPDGTGITLVNIGVGPSNAKTITDHMAVMRPEAWLMIGHCGGLRPSQRIGDYVLAHAYLRDDHVLDDMLPPEIPIPPIAEVQQALARAAEQVSGESAEKLKSRLRTGTIVTTDDRNWELRYSKSALRFSQSRAVGIDMESATIAAQGYRFRVPYGTLLCVSDKPMHGELKLPGQANRFYERAIAEHMLIGIEACRQLKAEGPKLHSRKLRAFNEPPFR
ncbi:MAG: AMP nucleosidase [Sphingomonadales bacterium]|jgi:AMP nucleosidase|nr:AMP nucleosidase [Sphingomonadales bacterium]MBK6720030.1 AMP nucleosidase [Sphingomonadales bacterium]MBK8271547.1 AMP nucleosidase [Sphingomonadales bacterium]